MERDVVLCVSSSIDQESKETNVVKPLEINLL
jgi:hypothetical protein